MNPIKVVNSGVWVVDKNMALSSLTIAQGASVAAPEGKALTMTVDGVGTALKPGVYKGDVFITVTDHLLIAPGGMRRGGPPQEFRAAVVIDNGKYVPGKSVPAIVKGGSITDKTAVGISMTGCEDDFNGIIVKGDSEYTIDKAYIEFEGEGRNDFVGYGAGIMAIDNTKLTINDTDIHFTGAWRCGFHGGGNSITTLNNCRITNISPVSEKGPPQFATRFSGSSRVTQCCDNATVYYNNCYVKSNGWGVLCVDGGVRTRIYAKDSTIELKGPRASGYGAFSIGDCFISFDNCKVNVQGYPFLFGGHGDKSDGEITNGSILNSDLNAVMMFRLQGGEIKVNKGSVLNSASSTFLVKGACAYLNVDNATLNPGNGVILQLMDNDDFGMGSYARFIIPAGIDKAIPGRDLTKADPRDGVFMTISNTKVKGDFYNSTTDLKPNCREQGPVRDMPPMPAPAAGAKAAPAIRMMDSTHMQGVKNLDLKFVKAEVEGIISAATAAYKDGLAVIDASNNRELGAVKQTAAEPINNGVIASFDKSSVWTVTGTSYLTSLTIAKGAVIKAAKGKALTLTVNGKQTDIAPGTYKGKVVIRVE